ncbi:MAG: hypothetical protein VR64_03250 [Desulfatitalea sp. BRH_c12]|nr:MAG: hypothetical protein VR64_03250 [Desulfatitalea sp. BRH_c12]
MVRPRKCRNINTTPEVTYFKPRGVPLRELAEVYLPLDGFEAIRLADFEGLSHATAAQRMHVSRQTFGRILSSARNTVAKALIGGLALRIHTADHPVAVPKSATVSVSSTDDRSAAEIPNAGKENVLMNTIAITSDGPTLDDAVDPRFGRAAGFIVIDPDTLSFRYVENGAAQVRAQGAGIQAAEIVAGTGATAVLTGYVGPKAFQALSAAGIRVAQDLENMTVREALERFKSGAVTWSALTDAKGVRA